MKITVNITDKDAKRIKELEKSKYTTDDILVAGIIMLEGCVAYAKEKES